MSIPQCQVCGDELKLSSDFDDEFTEYCCDNRVECEHPGCMTVTCDEDHKPRSCDLCGMSFCRRHLRTADDMDVCVSCWQEAHDHDAR